MWGQDTLNVRQLIDKLLQEDPDAKVKLLTNNAYTDAVKVDIGWDENGIKTVYIAD